MQRTKKLIDPYDLTIHLAQKNAKHPLQYDDVLAVIADEKRIEAVEVAHGRWVPLEYDGYADGNPVWDLWECSECGEEHSGDEDTLTPYCPNCGAKMDKEES